MPRKQSFNKALVENEKEQKTSSKNQEIMIQYYQNKRIGLKICLKIMEMKM